MSKRKSSAAHLHGPIYVQPKGCDEAWFYENKHSIDVVCYAISFGSLMCRIKKRQIKEWLSRVGLK